MASKQQTNLPVTTSAIVTESSREILGLKNFGIFGVFGVFIIVMMTTQWFPAAIVAAVATYTFIKRMIDSKPTKYIEHLILFHFFLPKKFIHRAGNGGSRRFRPETDGI